jgi:hypothetical protein
MHTWHRVTHIIIMALLFNQCGWIRFSGWVFYWEKSKFGELASIVRTGVICMRENGSLISF